MALFITQELLNSSKTFGEGMSLAVIKDIKEDPSKDPAWTNVRIFLEGLQGPGNKEDNVGRTVTFLVSMKALDKGVRQSIKNVVNMVCAAEKCKESDLIGAEINAGFFKKLVGRKVWIEVKDRLQDGNVYQDI